MAQPQAYADFHRRSIEDRDAFWAEQAQLVDWHKPFDRVCNHDNPPFAHWFEGGLTNLCHNAVDRRRPPIFSSTGLWSPGVNLTGFESAFGHKPLGSVRPRISWGAPRCIPGARLPRSPGHAPCW